MEEKPIKGFIIKVEKIPIVALVSDKIIIQSLSLYEEKRYTPNKGIIF